MNRRGLLVAAVAVATLALAVPNVLAVTRGRPAADLALTPLTEHTPVPGLRTYLLDAGSVRPRTIGAGPEEVRVGVLDAVGQPRGDVLFVHGHGDRLDNHAALFTAWSHAGLRVLAFDLPSHGETRGAPLDVWTFEDLRALAGLVVRATTTGTSRPLLLAGWSFGGLLAVRWMQGGGLPRPVAGLILLCPAVAPYPFTGGDGISRTETLTHTQHPPVAGPPTPKSPLANPLFAARLLAQAALADRRGLPAGLPTLVLTADPADDSYVNESAVASWARRTAAAGTPLELHVCARARHAIDLEPWPVGPDVTAQTARFAAEVAGGARTPNVPAGKGCS